MEENTPTEVWPDLIAGLYDRLSTRNAEIVYELDNLEIHVPDRAGNGQSKWTINGTMKLRTRDNAN